MKRWLRPLMGVIAAAGVSLTLGACSTAGTSSGTGAVAGGVIGGAVAASPSILKVCGPYAPLCVGIAILVGGAAGDTVERMVTSYQGPSFGNPAGRQVFDGNGRPQDGELIRDENGRDWVAMSDAVGKCTGHWNGTTWVPLGFDRHCRLD